MADALKILVVHNCENLAQARRSTLDYIYCFERYAPEHSYFYHRIMLPLTASIIETAWDAIIFDSTACGIVTIRPRERFHRIREKWAFLRRHPAVKIAFPQDDASHGALLDQWFNWMGIDGLFTVRPEKVDLIYPLTKRRADIVSTVSGFIDDATVAELSAFDKPFDARAWTVGQRVTMYPAWGGRFARRKGEAALRIKAECERHGLPQNISTNPSDVLLGDDWYRFLGNSRFVVGAEGGHGIWDPYGAIQDSVNDYVTRHPRATFDEIEDNCFQDLDGREVFPGFAPRVLEAALLGCGQILMEGNYRGFVRPGEHYIPLKEDFSNMADVFSAMANSDLVREMIAATRRDLVQSTRFRYSTLVAEVMGFVADVRKRKPGKAGAAASVRDKDWKAFEQRHFEQLRNALTIAGIEQEKLYEPYLSQWVARELAPQIRDDEMRRALGLALPSAPSEADLSKHGDPASHAHATAKQACEWAVQQMLAAKEAAPDAFDLPGILRQCGQSEPIVGLIARLITFERAGRTDIVELIDALAATVTGADAAGREDVLRLIRSIEAIGVSLGASVPGETESLKKAAIDLIELDAALGQFIIRLQGMEHDDITGQPSARFVALRQLLHTLISYAGDPPDEDRLMELQSLLDKLSRPGLRASALRYLTS